ncbi:DUF302 domain-containing protein [Acidiferrimicrobium sp. IK]|uniref:DUF302 domain-containing protein n=1 Tax=Acidiferrimicrobium sp. IK TaxID=2871700 RepID=UPI0021CB6E8A|nr:DUF302 domain-containing protein [Acidiferrimicrobium sp. IK]MCU4186013.1 DUF302 domain-containing protein [Acidiferrimicrobium sp. IK]
MEAFETTVAMSMPDAERVVREALSEGGFGVLTEIDVASTLAAKLGVERAPLKILGACNPAFAHRSLELDASVALLLPCNVVLEQNDPQHTRVAIADPRALLATVDSPNGAELQALASEAADTLEAVLARLQG